jgi:dynein heavy chain
MNSNEP